MTRGRKATATAAMLAAALVLSACGGDNDDEDPTTLDPAPTTTSAPPPDDTTVTTEPPDDTTATTEEPTLSPEEQDEADVEATVVTYYEEVFLEVFGETEASLEETYPLLVPPARDDVIDLVRYDRAQGWTTVGTQSVTVDGVSIDDGQATAAACLDVSELDVLDDAGESVVEPSRIEQQLIELVLVRDDEQQRSAYGWRISEIRPSGETCGD